MNNPHDPPKPPAVDTSLKKPLVASVIFHVLLVIVAIVGLPHFKTEDEFVEAVPLDLVADIGELTTAPKPPVKAPPKEEPEKEEPPPKAKEPPKPPPTPEKKSEPPPQDDLKDPPVKEKTVDDILDELAPPKKDEKKKPEPKKEAPKTKPKEESKEKAKDQKQDFDSLLKNLAPEEQTADTPADENLMTNPESSPDVKNVSNVLSISEMDALRQQLAGCWNIMAGAANAEDLKVEIRVQVNQDRTVRSAEVVDQSRYNGDTFFRAMAESAIRAVQNPRCSPLRLPPEKYNTWRTMTIVFDPKDMF